MRQALFILFVVLFSWNAYGQDPQFSQFYSAPMYLNPAFAGNTLQSRFVANYRNQWPSIPGAFVSYALSYDHNFEDINSGVALAIQHDKAGSAGLRYTNFATQYSYTIKLSRRWAAKPGLNFSYTIRDIDYSELLFGDQLLSQNSSSISVPTREKPVTYADIGAGGLLYSRNVWVGMAAQHLNQPNQSLIGGESKLPIRFSLHGGYNITVSKSVKKLTLSSITLTGNYKAQQKWDQLDLGLYFDYKPFVVGLWYRGLPALKSEEGNINHDALVVLLGYKINDFRVGYSYDLTISRLLTNTGGAHEISVIYEFASSDKKRKRKRQRFLVPCAKF